MSSSRSAHLLSFFEVPDLRPANNHKDGGCPGQDPCNSNPLVPLQMSTVTAVTRMVDVRVTNHAIVIVCNVADLKHANGHTDGACPRPETTHTTGGALKHLTNLNNSSILKSLQASDNSI